MGGGNAKNSRSDSEGQSPTPAQSTVFGSRGDSGVKYWRVKKVGSGSVGQAWLVETSDGKGTRMVAKEMDIPKSPDRDLRFAHNEIKCLAALKHPNIIRYYEDFVEGDKMYILTEFADCGDMSAQNQKRQQTWNYFQEHEVSCIAIQLAMALGHVHKHHILHRDLKSANVFVFSSGMVKLGDFGLSRDYEETVSQPVADTFCGTPNYIAPELWGGHKYGKKADMWGLGVVLYEMMSLSRPFPCHSVKGLKRAVLEKDPEPLPDIFSKGLIDLVLTLFKKDPRARPDTKDVLASPYAQGRLPAYEKALQGNTGLSQEDKDVLLAEIASIQGCDEPPAAADLPVSADGEILAGPVRKLTADKDWKDRYLRLNGTALVICASADAAEGGKGLPLSQLSSVCAAAPSDWLPEPNVFAIESATGQAIWLQAESAEAKDKWIEAIQLALSLL